ncbi:MAG: hypothetical protein ABFC94_04310 [Syntrophomonas sp.]
MNSLSKRIEAIRNDRSHGASELTRQALKIMQDAARASTADNPLEFLDDMRRIAGNLIITRTTMVSIRNSISRFMFKLIAECAKSDNNLESLQTWSVQTTVDLINIVAEARDKAIINATEFIPDGARLLTCSYSSTVIDTLKHTVTSGKSFNIMVLESQFGRFKYGEMAAARLAEKGIACTVIPDKQIKAILPQSDMILIGADAVLTDGSIINGCPSLVLARVAAENMPPVPVYSICESIKFYPGKTLSLEEEGFDLIPAQLIKGIITEDAILNPANGASHTLL